MKPSEIATLFVAELVRVAAAAVATSASSRPGQLLTTDGFVATVAAPDHGHGSLQVFFGRQGAEALARVMEPGVGGPSAGSIADTLRQICAQAAAACDPASVGARLAILSVESDEVAADDPNAQVTDIVFKGQEQTLQIAVTCTLELDEATRTPTATASRTIDVIMDIELPLVVRFGRTELPLKALTALSPGSVIDLGRLPDEPVEILISNRVVARGDVVVVSGHYGVRVREVISPGQRNRSLEG